MPDNENVLGILFGVDGGGDVNGASGKRIVDELTKIVNDINNGNSSVPKLNLGFDPKKIEKDISNVKKQLEGLQELGSGSVGGVSKNVSNDFETAKKTIRSYYSLLKERDALLRNKIKLSDYPELSNQFIEAEKKFKILFDKQGDLIVKNKFSDRQKNSLLSLRDEQKAKYQLNEEKKDIENSKKIKDSYIDYLKDYYSKLEKLQKLEKEGKISEKNGKYSGKEYQSQINELYDLQNKIQFYKGDHTNEKLEEHANKLGISVKQLNEIIAENTRLSKENAVYLEELDAKSNSKSSIDKQKETYDSLRESLKKYYSELKELQRLEADGKVNKTDKGYESPDGVYLNRVKYFNDLSEKVSDIFSLNKETDIEKRNAAIIKLGISVDQFNDIISENTRLSKENRISFEEFAADKQAKENADRQKETYDSLLASLKRYYAELKELQNIEVDEGTVGRSEYSKKYLAIGETHARKVDSFNRLQDDSNLAIIFNNETDAANKLGISIEQLNDLIAENVRLSNENDAYYSDLVMTKGQTNQYESLSEAIKKYLDLKKEVETAKKKTTGIVGGIDTDKEGKITGFSEWKTDGDYGDYYKTIVKEANNARSVVKGFSEDLVELIDGISDSGAKIDSTLFSKINVSLSDADTLAKMTNEEIAKYNTSMDTAGRSAASTWRKSSQNAYNYLQRLDGIANKNKQARAIMEQLKAALEKGDPKYLDEVLDKCNALVDIISETGADVPTWFQKFKKAFGDRVRNAFAGLITLNTGQMLRDVYNNVVKLDGAMTNLQIASGKTKDEVKQLTREYANLAKELGATTLEVAESADTWLRQGYSADESNKLIRNSTMLSKLGLIDATEASTALTSAMKGYGVSVDDSIRIVDRLVTVDMLAAASAGDIATAMAETATGARIAGLSMDKLIGYIATVKEVTQDGAESVGIFYKTLFARMGNVKAGVDIDAEGESLNDVEKRLKQHGINLRDSSGLFKNFGDVLDEVGEKWVDYNNVERHAIATALAGSKQAEKLIALLENYGKALEYTKASYGSNGKAAEKYQNYTDSVEGSLNSLTAAVENLSMTLLDSDIITGVVNTLTFIVDKIEWLSSALGGFGGIVLTTLGYVASFNLENIHKKVKNLANPFRGLANAVKLVRAELPHFTNEQEKAAHMAQLSSAKFTIAQAAISGIIAVISLAVMAYNKWKEDQENRIRAAVEESRTHIENAKAAKENAQSIKELAEQYEELYKENGGKFVKESEASNKVKSIQDEITNLVKDQSKNIDLVNGKLEKQKGILDGIYEGELKKKKDEAEIALASARNAIFWSMGKIDRLEDTDRELESYGIKFDGIKKKSTTLNTVENQSVIRYNSRVKTTFDTVEEFINQYKTIKRYIDEFVKELDPNNSTHKKRYDALNWFLNEYKDVYQSYIDAKDTIDQIYKIESKNKGGGANGMTVGLESALDILEKIQGAFDGISDALEDVDEQGYITAKSLSTLYNLQKENKLGGLELEKILIKDANGYKIAKDSLEQYVEVLIKSNAVEGAFASEEDRLNKIENLKTLRAVLATLIATKKKDVDVLKERKKALEKQKEEYDKQLDAYKELIDLRKKLLETYKEEIDYKKQLEEKQRNVSKLESKLAVARLDTSASGQLRVKELEKELKDAREDLDDFTLEHAIEVLTEQLDNQYNEYESFVKTKLDEISSLIEGLDTSPDITVNNDYSSIEAYLKDIDGQIEKLRGYSVDNDGITDSEVGQKISTDDYYYKKLTKDEGISRGGATNVAQEYIDKNGLLERDRTRWGSIPEFSQILNDLFNAGGSLNDLKGSDIPNPPKKIGGYRVVNYVNSPGNTRECSKEKYISAIIKDRNGDVYLNPSKIGAYNFIDIKGDLIKLGEGYSVLKDDGKNIRIAFNGGEPLYKYHSGGLVGGISQLSNNEVFAKLLKGEFVSTPTQMKRFMDTTLPSIANYSTSNGNEFNAPLISITCDNVTSDAIPKLKDVVDSAVKKIQEQLNNGMSRVGYKKQTKNLLI